MGPVGRARVCVRAFARALAWALACVAFVPACGDDDSEDRPLIHLSGTSLSFSAVEQGADPQPQEVVVSNRGGGTLGAPTASVQYQSGSDWLSVDVLADASEYTVRVQPEVAGLSAGTYAAAISVGSQNASNSPQTVSVTLEVAAPSTGFVRHPSNPVYASSGSSFNFAGIGDPCVLYDEQEGIYKMWTSAGGVVAPDPDVIVRTQYLTSPDGVTWTEYPVNPVLMEGSGPSDWDRGGVETVTVLKDSGQYYLWYGGYEVREQPPVTLKIGAATSSDGINWTRSPSNPVLTAGLAGQWDESWVESPTVVKVGSTFYMWYTGVRNNVEFRVGLATSSDGITWTKHPSNPVLEPEPANEWENGAVYAPAAVHDGTRFRMWYVGLNAVTFLQACRIGEAVSDDGIVWIRSASNPVLDVGAPGAWDETGPFVPTVVLKDGDYLMWYLSGANPNERIGLATWSP